MKRLIYTAVFGGYDRVYAPVQREADVDYVIFTDDPALQVPGWQTFPVDAAKFATPKAANLYHRALVHRLLTGYDASLYVDGNIRILGPTAALFEALEKSGAAMIQYPHPLRQTVREELEAVISAGKVSDSERVRQEVEGYFESGFPDDIGLGETTVLLKNHSHPKLDAAMEFWYKLFLAHLSRDQLSLPFVIWRTGLEIDWMSGSFREPNPYFALYPHIGASGINPLYVEVSARSHDNIVLRTFLALWHFSWKLRRVFRRQRQTGP